MPFAKDQAGLRREVRENEAILRETPHALDETTARIRGIALYQLGAALLRLEHSQEAEKRFAETAETLWSVPSLRGLAVTARVRQAGVLMMASRYEEALAITDEVISIEGLLPAPTGLNPDDFVVLGYTSKMAILEELDRLEDASAVATALIIRFDGADTPRQRGAVAGAFLARGRFAHKRGDLDASLQILDEAIARTASVDDKEALRVQAKALVERGAVLEEVGRTSEALASYDEAASMRSVATEDRAVKQAVKEALDRKARLSSGHGGPLPPAPDAEFYEHLIRAHHALKEGDIDTAVSVGASTLERFAALEDPVLVRECASQLILHARMLIQFQGGSPMGWPVTKALLFFSAGVRRLGSRFDKRPGMRPGISRMRRLSDQTVKAIPPLSAFASAAALQQRRNAQAEKVTREVTAALERDPEPEAQKLRTQAKLLNFQAQALVTGKIQVDELERISTSAEGDLGLIREAEVLRAQGSRLNVASAASLDFVRALMPISNTDHEASIDQFRWFVERHEQDTNRLVRAQVAIARLTIRFDGSWIDRTLARVRRHPK